MTTYGRGINVDMTSGGGDTVVGTGYGDTIAFGNGINYADGGANAGSPPSGGSASDSLQVFVANASEASAVAVTQLTSGLSGTDASAYTAGYAFKVVFWWTDRLHQEHRERQRPDLERCQ
jgi:hypothetical protein